MDGNHNLRLQHLDRAQGIIRSHGVVVADGDDRQIKPLLTDQFHIPEQPCILREVKFLSLVGGQQKAAGIAAVRAIGQHRAVQGECQFEIAERMFESAAEVLTVSLRHALSVEPGCDLEIADDRRARAFGNRDGVTHVVAVPVTDEQEVRFHLVGGGDSGGIP